MYFITTSGSPRERGRQHGEELREAVGEAVAAWGASGPVPWAGQRVGHWLAERQPETYAELQGIAEGAALDFDAILHHTIANSLAFVPQACTTMVLRGPDQRCVLAKTQDCGAVEARFQLVNEITDQTGRKAVVAGLVGATWAIAGINEDGLAGGINSAPGVTDEPFFEGLPQHQALYPLLRSEQTVSGALRSWLRTPLVGKGINGCLCDALGEAITFERAGARYAVSQASGSVHIENHFRDPGLQVHAARPGSENSYAREAYLNEQVAGRWFDDPVAEARRILADRTSPGCLNRALDETGAGTQSGYLADPASRTLAVADGAPGLVAWRTFQLG
ncbi:MAG: hypothetical protein HUU35_16600 [Armatimonadetes bacterium]|nr:hypothetical protein [Armatimonadota bacterium]